MASDLEQSILDLDNRTSESRRERNRAYKRTVNHLQNRPEYIDVVTAQESLKKAQKVLADALAGDDKYQSLIEDLDGLKASLNDNEELLSELIVSYVRDTGSKTVPIDKRTEKLVIMYARLSKPVKKELN